MADCYVALTVALKTRIWRGPGCRLQDFWYVARYDLLNGLSLPLITAYLPQHLFGIPSREALKVAVAIQIYENQPQLVS